MRLKIFIQHMLIFSFLISSCSHPVALKRVPASGPKSIDYQREKEFLNVKIFKYKGAMKSKAIRGIANLVIRSKIKKFLKDLKMDASVQESVMEKVKSKDFRDQFVPFLMAMMELYTADEKFEKKNFENYIKKIYPNPNSLPGLAHSLFTYDAKKDEKNKKVKEKNGTKKKKRIIQNFHGQSHCPC